MGARIIVKTRDGMRGEVWEWTGRNRVVRCSSSSPRCSHDVVTRTPGPHVTLRQRSSTFSHSKPSQTEQCASQPMRRTSLQAAAWTRSRPPRRCLATSANFATQRTAATSTTIPATESVQLPPRLATRNILKASIDLAKRSIENPNLLVDTVNGALKDLEQPRKPVIACEWLPSPLSCFLTDALN